MNLLKSRSDVQVKRRAKTRAEEVNMQTRSVEDLAEK
jgi:hypothetical protein